MRTNWDYPRFSCHSLKRDGYYYFNYNSGLQPQSVVYRVKKGHELEALKPNPSRPDQKIPGGELFFDPNLLSTDGTAALSSVVISHSGKYLAYGVSRSGSDWNTIYVRRTDSPHTKSADDGGARGEDPGRLEDVIRFVKFGQATWLKDDSGLLIWLR